MGILMNSLFESSIDPKVLFTKLYQAPTENEVDKIIKVYPDLFKQDNWHPYGNSDSNYAVIENQASHPIRALVEKVTNSIDAILTKECLLKDIDPKSLNAPITMEQAVKIFFKDQVHWDDLMEVRRSQALEIQIIADGPRRDTSIIVYDNGEGQNPEDFEDTFLSMLKGNKDEIKFVQGKYNMGGSGSIVFCGKRRYHLIASKRYDGKGNFGFTLIRKHPMSKEEQQKKKSTWYEYFVINGKIPSFSIDELDLGLYRRKFITGTILKLYSYELSRISDISRDLTRSLNEFIFEPALPMYIVEKRERYPDNKALERHIYGLKRKLEEDKSKYVDEHFREVYEDKSFGKLTITCYVFNARLKGKNVKESKKSIENEFFKNRMSTLLSLNGQVHGDFSDEFISRTLKMPLLKGYLLIHVDCTDINYAYRENLFMASRDRIRQGNETKQIRDIIGSTLRQGKLKSIYKQRKDSISFSGEDKSELLKSFAKNLPMKSELLKLINQTFRLEETKPKTAQDKKNKKKTVKNSEPFNPKRFPTYLRYGKDGSDEKTVVKVPLGGKRTLQFHTDVENEYFVRVEEPGDMRIALLTFQSNETTGGTEPGEPKNIEDVFNVIKGSPDSGKIKIVLNPTKDVSVGDSIQVKVSLTAPGDELDQIFKVKISEPEQKKEPSKKTENDTEDQIGLPEMVLVYREKQDNEDRTTWDDLESAGLDMTYETVMHPLAEGDKLERIYVNMDSGVIKDYKAKLRRPEQYEMAEKRFYTAVYFHTLFLYTISISKKYSFSKDSEDSSEEMDLATYLKDLFDSYYAQFLISFGIDELVQSLGD